jgi:hypothetical protein
MVLWRHYKGSYHSILYLQHFLCYNNQRRNPTEAVVTINITPKTKELGIRLARAINLVMEAYRIPGWQIWSNRICL